MFKQALKGFLLGGIAGAIIGALGGMFDRGSLFIMVPSGPLFWAILGTFIGSIAGALVGVLATLIAMLRSSSKQQKPEAHSDTLDKKDD